jgi:hypothetical protein
MVPPTGDAPQRVEAGEQPASPASDERIPFFRGRSRAKEFAAQLDELRGRVDRLGLLPVVELESRRARLEAETATLAENLEHERAQAATVIEKQTADTKARAQKVISDLQVEASDLEAQLARLRQEVVVTEETSLLQEVGLYEYRHPLTDAVAYQAELKRLQDMIKVMALKDGGARLYGLDGQRIEGTGQDDGP